MKKKAYNLLQVIIIIVITSIISGITVGVIINNNISTSSGISYSELLNDNKVQEFLNVYSTLLTDYYEEVDKDELMNNAIKAMTDYLDESYTTYLDENQTDKLNESLNKTYDGIGISISQNKVINVVYNSPAAKAGIIPGDLIQKINDEDVTLLSANDITKLISTIDDNINIEISRNGEIFIYNLQKATLPYPAISYYIYNDSSIGYLKINVFSNKLDEEVRYAIDYFKDQNITGLVMDLRNNYGGYLEQAEKVSSLFLNKGETIYYLENKEEVKKVINEENKIIDVPIIIITNKQTASSAEILTSALIENEKAISIGQITYGKGKVQHMFRMKDGSTVKYTSSNWLTPKKKSINNKGIEPSYIVENEIVFEDENQTIIKDVIDSQLNFAIELLSK